MRSLRRGGLLFVSVAVALVSSVAYAQQRPMTPDLNCAAARQLVSRAGAIVLSTGPYTYDRYVRDRSFCQLGEIRSRPGFRRVTQRNARSAIAAGAERSTSTTKSPRCRRTTKRSRPLWLWNLCHTPAGNRWPHRKWLLSGQNIRVLLKIARTAGIAPVPSFGHVTFVH